MELPRALNTREEKLLLFVGWTGRFTRAQIYFFPVCVNADFALTSGKDLVLFISVKLDKNSCLVLKKAGFSVWLDDPLTHSHLNVLSPDASSDEEYEKKVTCLESITMVIVLILQKSVSSL